MRYSALYNRVNVILCLENLDNSMVRFGDRFAVCNRLVSLEDVVHNCLSIFPMSGTADSFM